MVNITNMLAALTGFLAFSRTGDNIPPQFECQDHDTQSPTTCRRWRLSDAFAFTLEQRDLAQEECIRTCHTIGEKCEMIGYRDPDLEKFSVMMRCMRPEELRDNHDETLVYVNWEVTNMKETPAAPAGIRVWVGGREL